MIKNGQCLHVVLFGTYKENKYFLGDFKDSFDLIGFNANIVAHAPGGMAAFISQLSNKSFFIDPQIYAFQQPLKTIMRKKEDGKWALKMSIEKLSADYGPAIEEKAGIEAITPQSLKEEDIKEICKRVLDFESNKIKKASENLDVKEFLDFSGEELKPLFLVAPYFYLEPDNLEKELEVNMKFITESKAEVSSNSSLLPKIIYAEIVIDKDILIDSKEIEKVIKEYSACVGDGFLIWVDNFLEISESEKTLRKYKDFLIELSKCGKPIIAMHGSYFSISLAGKDKKLLAGVGHGIEYGEYRPIIPVGGGVPLAKFYFPKFHKRVDYDPDANNILLEMGWAKNKQAYLSKVCSCNMCKKIITTDVETSFHEYGEIKISKKNNQAYPTASAMDKSRTHYLHNKVEEYLFCRSATISSIIEKLQENQKTAEKLKVVHPFDHLKKWINVLGS